MINEKNKQCKNKECCNPVLEGRYCQRCAQKRREKRDGILAIATSAIIVVGGVVKVKKKDLIRKAPKIAAKVLRGALKL